MKIRKSLFLSLVALTAALALEINFSKAQNYKEQFKVTASGKAENAQGTALGMIEQDGTIKNSHGEVVGKIVKKDKQTELLDKLGNKVGEALETGSFKNVKGEVMYTVLEADKNGECQIKDKSGKLVGSVHENYKQQGACLYHCLHQSKK